VVVSRLSVEPFVLTVIGMVAATAISLEAGRPVIAITVLGVVVAAAVSIGACCLVQSGGFTTLSMNPGEALVVSSLPEPGTLHLVTIELFLLSTSRRLVAMSRGFTTVSMNPGEGLVASSLPEPGTLDPVTIEFALLGAGLTRS